MCYWHAMRTVYQFQTGPYLMKYLRAHEALAHLQGVTIDLDWPLPAYG